MNKRTFTEADREAFAGLLPFAPGGSVPFTPKAFLSVEESRRPVFRIRPYPQKDRDFLASHIKSGTYDKVAIAAAMENGAVVGWENLRTLPDGSEVLFGKGVLQDFPDLVFYQLHERITELTVGPAPTSEEKEGLTS